MNHDIAYKVGEDDEDDEKNGDDGEDDDDYDNNDGLLQSLICTCVFHRAKFGNYFFHV